MTAGPRCGVVVDSGAALVPEPHLGIVPLRLEVDGRLVGEGELASGELVAGATVRSSTPAPGEYAAVMRGTAGDALVVLTMSAQLSGMHAAATVAAAVVAESGDGRPVTVVDTGAAAGGFALVTRLALAQLRAGADAATVAARARQAGERLTMVGTLRTLAPLARSGRLPALVAGVADRLRVQPVFELVAGRGQRLGLARTESAAERLLIDAALERARQREPAAAVVFHTAAAERAERVAEGLQGVLDGGCVCLELPAVAGSYTGPGMVGVALAPLEAGEPPVR